ncbi:MAG: Stp1/IreP family PP2C-type Ser/Thr phosphatase [Atopobiaceae bacterium]|jgi:serine/threonine protein phosphatase PrpC
MTDEKNQAPQDAPSDAVNAPGRSEMPVANRAGAATSDGTTDALSWGARSDVGLVREQNEDSFLVRAPLFCVCDGMGGHAAGEIASRIAVDTICANAPAGADDIALGVAVEQANAAVIESAGRGQGKPGMGSTATCVVIEKNKMAIAHVGDSRVYLLHAGTLVRLTHDHSYVEELVDAGEITADEARTHPSRSIITRALGSDPDMYADHFIIDVTSGDRVLICSDGLSSMVADKDIESVSISSASPQAAADNLVSAALTAGGHDNVTVVVIDVLDDGLAEVHRRMRRRGITTWMCVALIALATICLAMFAIIRNDWYVADNNGTVGVYRGLNDELFGIPLSELQETSSVLVKDLPAAVQVQLESGIYVGSSQEARETVERYRDQIDEAKTRAAQAAAETQSSSGADQTGTGGTQTEDGSATPDAAAQTGQEAAQSAQDEAVAEATNNQSEQE